MSKLKKQFVDGFPKLVADIQEVKTYYFENELNESQTDKVLQRWFLLDEKGADLLDNYLNDLRDDLELFKKSIRLFLEASRHEGHELGLLNHELLEYQFEKLDNLLDDIKDNYSEY